MSSSVDERKANSRFEDGIASAIALLGRRDQPTDAIEDYCRLLGSVFKNCGSDFTLRRVAWDQRGWPRALSNLWRTSADWKGKWALVQYTALMWSRRGLPLVFPLVICVLKIRGVRTSVIYHDSNPYNGRRLADRIRCVCQRMVMRWGYKLSDRTILTIPLERARWLPRRGTKAAFIPIGGNLPVIAAQDRSARNGHKANTITVFGITDGGDIGKEVANIALAAIRAAENMPRVRLVTVGRGSSESASRFRQALKGSSVEFCALGVLPAEEVSQVLADSDVALFVRSPITTQRGTAIASIANGVPLVAFTDSYLAVPLAEAGVVGVPYADSDKLADATVRVLTDPQLWHDLHERSRRAYEKYFTWEAVADRFLEVLHHA